MSIYTVATIQMNSTPDVEKNLETTVQLCIKAADQGATLIVLPENFAYLGPEKKRFQIAESITENGPILQHCKKLAKDLNCELILGGFPEKTADLNKTANSCIHLNKKGELQAIYRKIHLFDVDLPDGSLLRESDTVIAGDNIVVTKTDVGIVGLSICYDLRFPELYRQLVNKGATVLAIPAAFTQITGQAHWHVLLRARAIENQCYVLAAAQTGHHFADRYSFGHAMIVDPWGNILAECQPDKNDIALATIDTDYIAKVRSQLPCLQHRQIT